MPDMRAPDWLLDIMDPDGAQERHDQAARTRAVFESIPMRADALAGGGIAIAIETHGDSILAGLRQK
jgi:hypothetical protein